MAVVAGCDARRPEAPYSGTIQARDNAAARQPRPDRMDNLLFESPLKSWADITYLVAGWGGAVMAIVGPFEGARQFALGDRSRKTFVMFIGGGLLAMVMGTVSFWAASTVEDTRAMLVIPQPTELSSDWGSALLPEEREKASRSYASVVYVDSGALTRYFDRTSGWMQYCPTKDDIALRDKTVATRQHLEDIASGGYSAGARWYGTGFMAALLGWLTAREQRRKVSA
jgi:hypothetical protein